MEHRIESMETILLEREALSKGTRQMIDNYEQLNNQGNTGATACANRSCWS